MRGARLLGRHAACRPRCRSLDPNRTTVLVREEKHPRFDRPRRGERSGADADLPLRVHAFPGCRCHWSVVQAGFVLPPPTDRALLSPGRSLLDERHHSGRLRDVDAWLPAASATRYQAASAHVRFRCCRCGTGRGRREHCWGSGGIGGPCDAAAAPVAVVRPCRSPRGRTVQLARRGGARARPLGRRVAGGRGR